MNNSGLEEEYRRGSEVEGKYGRYKEGQERDRRTRNDDDTRASKHGEQYTRSRWERSEQFYRRERERKTEAERNDADLFRASSYRDRVRDTDTDHLSRHRRREDFTGSGVKEDDVPTLFSIHRGTVHSVRSFGIFVQIDGYKRHGLVHVSQVAVEEVTNRNDSDEARVQALRAIAAEGGRVWVKVIQLSNPDEPPVKIGCSMKVVDQSDGKDLDPDNKATRFGGREGSSVDKPGLPELYSIHRAVIESIRPFGYFVRISDYRKHGLVPLSQVSDFEVVGRHESDQEKVKSLESVAAVGESVWVKVVEVKHEEDGRDKVACSMKLVKQSDGTDLDPTHIRAESTTAHTPWAERPKLEIGAVLNVTCTRCGGHGHLKSECFSADGRQWDLVPEDAALEREFDERRSSKGNNGDGTREASKDASYAGVEPTFAVGRGKAMVEPAWMKHGVGSTIGDSSGTRDRMGKGKGSKGHRKDEIRIGSVEEAQRIIKEMEEERARRKARRKEKREGKKEKDGKRHRSKKSKKESSKGQKHAKKKRRKEGESAKRNSLEAKQFCERHGKGW